MKWRNRKVIFGTAALTAIGLAGASLAAQGTEQAAQATEQVAENDLATNQTGVVSESTPEAVESAVEDDKDAVEAETEVETESGAADSGEDAAENEAPIVGTALERASAVALEFTGSGKVTATEVGDEESYYEVEVTLDDGRQIDVQLDESFNVVGTD